MPHVVVMGVSGCGKTTVGRLLAREDSQARRVINPASLINLATRQEDEANKKKTCCK